MATYTDNYSLTKPTFAEVADIRTINGNMDTIDDIMHASQVSLADAYDQTATYNTGDVVMYEFLMYKCKEDNVTGNWDATKWERTTAAKTGGGEVDFDLFGEASGNPASFADGATAGLVECIADIEAAQDLHGYDKPWAGGAGKNILPLVLSDIKALNTAGIWSGNIYSYHGINFEIITDSNDNVTGIRLNGVSSSSNQPVLVLTNKTFNATNYIINGIPTGASDNTYFLNMNYSDGTNVNYSTTTTLIKTVNITAATIYVRRSQTINNIEFNPMISQSGGDYEPYSNICPISGHSSVTINVSPTSDPSQGLNVIIQLGNTYYGGILNVLTGELTVTHVCKTLTTADLNISYVSAASDANSYYYNLTNAFSSGEIVNDASGRSNIFKWYRNLYSDRTIEGITGQGAYVSVRVNSSRVADTSPDALKAYLPATWQVYAKLNTFQTVQLTPQEVNSLLGQNNISADTGDVDIVYVKASAPIQPNPTGTPTATLKKLGIEGTVFELEGEGGGSSGGIHYSTTEKVVGTVEMDNGTIKPLYEKSWWLTIPSQSGGYTFPNTAMADLDQVISNEYSFGGRGMRSYTYWYAGASVVFDEHTSSGISFYFGSGDYGGRMIFYTARYTKITN